MPRERDYIYVNDPIPISWTTKADLTDLVTPRIRYTKLSGATGLLTLTESPTIAGKYLTLLPGSNNNESGEWQFRAWHTFSYDPNPIRGRIFKVVIHKEDESE